MKSKQVKREEAIARQSVHNTLSVEQKILKLAGRTAIKERTILFQTSKQQRDVK